MLKAYLDTETSVKPEFNPDVMSKEAYDALFDEETGYLTKFKKMADAGEIYIFTKDLIVHSDNLVDAEGNKLPPTAGEIDMIIVDRKGNKFIVDLKTGKTDKWMFYNIMNSRSYEKKLENTLQQTGYANLAQNMSGEVFGIKIFPLEVAYDKNGKLITAGAPTNPILFTDEEVIGDEGTEPYTITLERDAVIRAKNPVTKGYEDISIANLMQRLVPNMSVKPKATSKSKPVNKMVPEEEQGFVDDFVKNLEDVKDFDSLTDVFAELDKAKPRLSAVSYKMLKALLDSQASKMFEEDTNIDIKTGEIYIFTQPVKSQKIPEGYRVIVNSFNPETGEVEISRVGPGRKKSFTMDVKEFTSIAMSEEMINQGLKADEQYEPSDEEVQHIADSITVTGDELSDFAQLAKWNDEASADDITPDQLKNDFFKNFKCPSK
jgi:Holliday junction resolvase-like predicted endonuclease